MKFIEFNQINRLKLAVESVSRLMNEVKTTPGTLSKFGSSSAAQQVVAGFEAEMIFAGALGLTEPEVEPDYSENPRAESINQIIEFFQYDGNMSSREAERERIRLEEEYTEYTDNHFQEYVNEHILDAVKQAIEGELDPTEAFEHNLASYGLNQHDIEKAMRERFDNQQYQRAYQDFNFNIHTLAEMSVKDKNDYYDVARDQLEESYEYPSESEWLDEIEVNRMSDAEDRWNFTWPMYQYNYPAEEGFNYQVSEDLATSLQRVLGQKVQASTSYHGVNRTADLWIIEPDNSIEPDDEDSDMPAEIISPPMPLEQMLSQMEKLFAWAKMHDAYTNDSTGLHIGVSLPNIGGNVDYVKLALFLGDKYVLDQFGRAANTYTASFVDRLKGQVEKMNVNALVKQLKSNLINNASETITNALNDKYVSINPKGSYVEFRSPGGSNYEQDFNKIKSTVLRFAHAMMIAADPNAAKQEYLKKFYQLIASTVKDHNTASLFARLATNEITAEEFKKAWATQVIKQADAADRASNDWQVIDKNTNRVVKIYNNMSRGSAVTHAHADLDPEISRIAFLQKYNIIAKNNPVSTPRLATALRIAK